MLANYFVVFLALCVAGVWSHGSVWYPPNRSSLWRQEKDQSIPKNYNDNEMFCGGFGVQWQINGGKCGPCGDDYRKPRPRANENLGEFGKGFIVDRSKFKAGSTVTTQVKIVANHWGYFNFSVCCMEDPTKTEPEDCFKQIKIGDGSWSWQMPNHNLGIFEVPVIMPEQKCDHAVLQWVWKTANSWGNCDDGSSGMGCGPQEQFRSCSDMAIV